MTHRPAHLHHLTRRRMALAITGAGTLTLLLLIVCPLIGVDMDRHFDLLDLREVLRGAFGTATGDSQIFLVARLPRVLAATLVGAGLAAAGCGFQAVLRNPLAEPYTLGISSGSALAAVLAIRFGLDTTALGQSAVGLAALGGSGLTVLAVWQLGRVGSALPPATLLLGGITIATFCAAATMLIQYTSDLSEIGRIVRWMMGGLDWIRYREILLPISLIAIGLLVLLLQARDLNALSAGADAAASVGVDPTRATTITFVTASLMVGATISIAGPIGFVGLIVPHAMRGLVGPDHRVLLPTSMLAGGALLAACDTAARMILFPSQIPVGVVTALAGGPFFLYLIVREKDRGQLWGG